MDQKPKVFALNNIITSKTDRLPSLSSLSKRDLALEGDKPKKVYKPNLNVVRKKQKCELPIYNKVPRQQSNMRRSLSTRTKRNRYIQSSSIFSEGAGKSNTFKRPSSKYLGYRRRDQIGASTSKVVNWKVNTYDGNAVLLPDDNDDNSSESEGSIDNLSNCDMPWSFQNNNMYNEDRLCISLLKMPDLLLGKGLMGDPNEVNNYDLSQMTEGKIGRVVTRRSGKVEIQIGNMKYVLDSVDVNPFKEDIISISGDPKSSNIKRGDMINLGNIDEKYVLSLNLKNLFPLKALRELQKKK